MVEYTADDQKEIMYMLLKKKYESSKNNIFNIPEQLRRTSIQEYYFDAKFPKFGYIEWNKINLNDVLAFLENRGLIYYSRHTINSELIYTVALSDKFINSSNAEDIKMSIEKIIKFGDIVFNLSQETFQIGDYPIKGLSFAKIREPSLEGKTPKTIRRLFAIAKEFELGNNIIREDPRLYEAHFKEFDKIFPPKRKSKTPVIGCSIYNLKALLKLSKEIEINRGEKGERILSIKE